MKNIIILLLLASFSLTSWAQQANTVKGKVKDSENKPLIGVNVVIKGSSRATITDSEGNFTIRGTSGEIHLFSYTSPSFTTFHRVSRWSIYPSNM